MKAIAAMSLNRVIGYRNTIPWRLPDDFKWFKKATSGFAIVMGRRTFESLGHRALPGRINFVLTKHPEEFAGKLRSSDTLQQLGVSRVRVGAEAVTQANVNHPVLPGAIGMELRIVTGLEVLERHGLTENAWLCGGASIYEQFLPRCSDLYLSVVKREVAGDALFPQFEHLFTLREIVLEHPEFEVRHYVRNPA